MEKPHADQPPSLLDLLKAALDIKNNLLAAISDLKSDIKAVAHCLTDVEQTSQTHAEAIRQVQKTYNTQLPHIFDLHRQVEDLDNRGRRHNIRGWEAHQGIDAATGSLFHL